MRINTDIVRREIVALACAFAIACGGVVAPTAHFVFMLSGTHADSGNHHSSVDDRSGPRASEPQHEPCEYAKLLCSVAPAVGPVPVRVASFVDANEYAHHQNLSTGQSFAGVVRTRGPPVEAFAIRDHARLLAG